MSATTHDQDPYRPENSAPKSERRPLLSSEPGSYGTSSPDSHNIADPEIAPSATTAGRERDHGIAEEGENGVPKERTAREKVLWAAVLLAVLVGGWALVRLLKQDSDFDFDEALKAAIGGGVSGAAAMVLQVLTLMPLRTVMNYQYRYGTSTAAAILTLYLSSLTFSGRVARFYQGLPFALVQAPLARFGDTAANAGVLALLASSEYTRRWPLGVKTALASTAAALFRMGLMPVDTVKTTLQARGREGWGVLRRRMRKYGIGTLWYGAFATAGATFVGHYPWFATYNYLSSHLPPPAPPHASPLLALARQALIGFLASVASDTTANSLHVLKTYRQVDASRVSYADSARAVIRADGWRGLFGRGLKTRILANGLQGVVFAVLWKFFMDLWDGKMKGMVTTSAFM